MVPYFLFRYSYNILKCIMSNYINSDLFTFISTSIFKYFLLFWGGYFFVGVQTVIGIYAIKTDKIDKTELIVSAKILFSLPYLKCIMQVKI